MAVWHTEIEPRCSTASMLFESRLESCRLIFTDVVNNPYVTSQCMS